MVGRISNNSVHAPKRPYCWEGSVAAVFFMVVVGCAGPVSEETATAPSETPLSPSVAPSSPQVPDVQRQSAEVRQPSLERNPSQEKVRPLDMPDDLQLRGTDAWWNYYQQALKWREESRKTVINEFDQQMQRFIASVPANQLQFRLELQQKREQLLKDDTAVPLYSQVGEAARVYVARRLEIEESFVRALETMMTQIPPQLDTEKVRIVAREINLAQRSVSRLHGLRPQVNGLSSDRTTVGPGSTAASPSSVKPTEVNTVLPTAVKVPSTPTPDWKVVADPGPPLPTWPEEFPYRELTGPHPGVVVYPPGLTAFLMAGIREGGAQYGGSFENILVGDIRRGKPVGPMIRDVDLTYRPTDVCWRPALSADGQHVAYLDSLKRAIIVVQSRTATVLKQIPMENVLEFALFFLTSDRLLALDVAHNKKGIVFNFHTGEVSVTFPVDEDAETETGYFAISPGGRYLALAYKDREALPDMIVLIDLTNGQRVGKIRPGGAGGRGPAHINAVAFSPDGHELAAFVGYPDSLNLLAHAPTLFVWKLDTGQEIDRVVIETGGRGSVTTYKSPEPLQWFPDKKAVLIHHQLVINRADGRLLDVVPAEGDVYAYFATKVLDDQRVLRATHGLKLIIHTVRRTQSP